MRSVMAKPAALRASWMKRTRSRAWPSSSSSGVSVVSRAIRQIREVRSDPADGIFDDGSAIDERKMGKFLAEVPLGQRMGMLGSFDGLKLRPGEQCVGR